MYVKNIKKEKEYLRDVIHIALEHFRLQPFGFQKAQLRVLHGHVGVTTENGPHGCPLNPAQLWDLKIPPSQNVMQRRIIWSEVYQTEKNKKSATVNKNWKISMDFIDWLIDWVLSHYTWKNQLIVTFSFIYWSVWKKWIFILFTLIDWLIDWVLSHYTWKKSINREIFIHLLIRLKKMNLHTFFLDWLIDCMSFYPERKI